MREVNHRSNNILTLMQAIARQTAASQPDDFLRRLTSAFVRSRQPKTCPLKASGKVPISNSLSDRSLHTQACATWKLRLFPSTRSPAVTAAPISLGG